MIQASLIPRITSRLSPSKIVRLGTLQTPTCALVVVMMFSLRRESRHAKDRGKPCAHRPSLPPSSARFPLTLTLSRGGERCRGLHPLSLDG